jgi:hypothetical protein
MVEEISDPAGMASTRLAEAVGYPGSSVAFAQLLSGMERDGLLLREVRGKRTYRITLPEGVAAGRLSAAQAGGQPFGPDGVTAIPDVIPASAAAPGFDYDELARRLLVQVIRRLSATSGAPSAAAALIDDVDAPSAVAEHSDSQQPADVQSADVETAAIAALQETEALRQTAALQETVAGLERELATAWTRHGSLTAENARLREQLQEAQRNLALERTRKVTVTGELNQAEVVLLERLLQPTPEAEEGADATAS